MTLINLLPSFGVGGSIGVLLLLYAKRIPAPVGRHRASPGMRSSFYLHSGRHTYRNSTNGMDRIRAAVSSYRITGSSIVLPRLSKR